MIFDFHLGSLFFKFILYLVMLLFFIYKFNSISKKNSSSNFNYNSSSNRDSNSVNNSSLSDAFRNDLNSIFKVSKIYHILFIVLANILFVSAIYFVLSYLGSISIIQFNAPLFGDFTGLGFDVTLLYLITVVILSPIIEEFLFRGIFLRRFNLELDNLTLAILISSVLFGICHNFGGILGAILFGICVSILYVKSRNVLVPILAHFINNLISFLLALIGIENFIHGNSIVIALIIILAIISNFVLFRAIVLEWPKSFKE
ncbi:CAAX amino terminal protease family protein [Methanobrevibacter ruminantium M1]|uniref:CAAX amino terminal protease family protein n=2 Tax=Methanobrevibacter ruminantium TaxID=83816 RepID=D3DZD4_METRM|nr:CAAX amino terminal protease family protein [Methanobrevibacter ruminantium M1]